MIKKIKARTQMMPTMIPPMRASVLLLALAVSVEMHSEPLALEPSGQW